MYSVFHDSSTGTFKLSEPLYKKSKFKKKNKKCCTRVVIPKDFETIKKICISYKASKNLIFFFF